MKVKNNKFSILTGPQNASSFYNIFLSTVYKIKPYLFGFMCFYYLLSFALYYLKAPSSINSYLEFLALIVLISVGISSYDSLTKIRGGNELKEHLAEYDDFSKERKVITSNYYQAIVKIYTERTAFDEYSTYAAIFPVVFLLCFGWFDTLFVLYLASIGFHKHFLDNEVESIERIKNVIDKPSL